MKKKATKKSTPTVSRKKTVKDLDVTPAKGGTIRGGLYSEKSGGGAGSGGTGGGSSGRPKV